MLSAIVIGIQGAGKTTLSSIIADEFGMRAGATSDRIYEVMAVLEGCSVGELKAGDKTKLRPRLAALGDRLCEYDICALSKSTYRRGARVIDGIRRREELAAFKAWLGDGALVLWVDRPGHKPEADNTTVAPSDARFVIRNDGTPDSMRAHVVGFLEALGFARPQLSLAL